MLVKDIRPGQEGSEVRSLTNVNGTLFFTANDGRSGRELWKSDGTESGTVLVKDIRPGSSAAAPSSLTNANGTLFFIADDGTSGAQLWKSDGTESGTALVIDMGGGGSEIHSLAGVNGTLFFNVALVLWRSDGTPAATFPLKSNSDFPASSLTNVNGMLFFSAHGIWQSDGTKSGTVRTRDILPDVPGTYPRSLTNVNGTLFFTDDDGLHGRELWVLREDLSDPLAAGDADRNLQFDQQDIAQVLQGAKYLTGEPATWEQGDWNSDGVFNQLDVIAALQTGNFLQGPYAVQAVDSRFGAIGA